MNHQNKTAPDALPCEVCTHDTRFRAEIEGSRFPLCHRHGGLHHDDFTVTEAHRDYWMKLEVRGYKDTQAINEWRLAHAPKAHLTATLW